MEREASRSTSAISGGDLILEWNRIAIDTIGATPGPFVSARFLAITQVAVFEAVNAITGDYEPYLGTVAAPPGASAEAAAVVAAHNTLLNYFPAAASSLDAARDESLSRIADGQSKEDGKAVGAEAAAAAIAARASDGSEPPQFFSPVTPGDPGQWQTTPSCTPEGGILFHWQFVAPFGVESNSQFRLGPPPGLGTLLFARDYDEVKELGRESSTSRTQAQTDNARFWALTFASYGWNDIARQIVAAEGDTLSATARAFALLNMAGQDGLVASMDTKYAYTFWRPETAIRAGDTDCNPKTDADPTYAPLILTPCFPSWPSAHASGSYAYKEILQKIYGSQHDVTLTHPNLPGVVMNYTDLDQATAAIDDARVHGGIHYRFDQRGGQRQGTDVGRYVFRNNLRPLHGGGEDDCDGDSNDDLGNDGRAR